MRITGLLVVLAACSNGEGQGDGDGDVSLPTARTCAAPGFSEPLTPAVEWERTTFQDWPVVQHFPDQPVGFVFYFHGTGGNFSDVGYVEVMREMETLSRAGFAFASTESEDRSEGAQWDRDPDWRENPDLARLEAMYEDFVASGRITAETPVFTSGFSDGGGMSGTVSTLGKEHGWPVAAAAIHNSGGVASPEIPQIWVIAENDLAGIPTNSAAAYEETIEEGGHAVYLEVPEEPLDPARLLRIPRFDQASADQAFADLVEYGIIDESGVRLIDLETQLESSLGLFESKSKVAQDWEVSTQLRVNWATHRFDSRHAQEVCEFFVDAL